MAAFFFVSGERVIGQIVSGDSETIAIRSSALAERRISLDVIDTIQPVSDARRRAEAVSTFGLQKKAYFSLADVSGRGTASPQTSKPQPAESSETRKPKPIGQKPEDEVDIRKIFLRQSTVLLRPGQLEVEASINYLNNQAVSPILNARFRQLRVPLSARIGLFNRAKAYLTVPVVHANRVMSFAGSVASYNESGIGDVDAGINYEIMRETARWPDIIASARLGIATGSKPNEQGLSLGSGHWSTSFGVQFIKTVDPVALFGGLNYTHEFDARYFYDDDVYTVSPGEAAGYNFGFGFAANENVSLSAQVIGSYQSGTIVGAGFSPNFPPSISGGPPTGMSPTLFQAGIVDILSNAPAGTAVPCPVFLQTCSDSQQVW